MSKFSINLEDKPALYHLQQKDKEAFKTIVGTFVQVMEVAASKQWHKLPEAIHTSLSFSDVIGGVLNAVMTTEQIDPQAYATLEYDLHPLALISDKRKNLISGESEGYDWKKHFALDTNEVSKDALEHIIRKILYLVRWFDIESVSKSLTTNTFPVVDNKDIQKLPFQPALVYQIQNLGELHVGKFLHEIGAFNCGKIDKEKFHCPACVVGNLEEIDSAQGTEHKVCPRCNAGFIVNEELEF